MQTATDLFKVRINAVVSPLGYFHHNGAPLRHATYVRHIASLDDLMPSERMDILRQYADMQGNVERAPVDPALMNPHTLMGIIIEQVCRLKGVPVYLLIRKTRKREVVYARQLCMYLVKKKTQLSMKVIGERLGGKDHTTVIHSIRTISDLMDTRDEVLKEVMHLLSMDFERLGQGQQDAQESGCIRTMEQKIAV